mgnify:CR=1 FL=1
MSSSIKRKNGKIMIKIGMLGDAGVGKTSLMVKYVHKQFSDDYRITLGVNFLEKKIHIKKQEITFIIWDLGGKAEFIDMLPLVCNEANILLFMFDLSRKSTLSGIKQWYMQAKNQNKRATPFVIGTKYDLFADMDSEYQAQVTKQARRYAKVMKAPLIFCSSAASINIQKIFKIALIKIFGLQASVSKIAKVGDPIIEY